MRLRLPRSTHSSSAERPVNPKEMLEWSKQVWADVQANVARLDGCAGPHDFVPVDPTQKLNRRWVCTKCKGGVDNIARIWYERGRDHERRSHAGRDEKG